MEATPRLIPSERTRTSITLLDAVGRLFLRPTSGRQEGRKAISSPGAVMPMILEPFTYSERGDTPVASSS